MYTHLTEQLANQQQAELQARSTRNGHASHARRAPQSPRPNRSQGRAAAGHHPHRHPIRRRAGYALVSLGLRLVYVADEG